MEIFLKWNRLTAIRSENVTHVSNQEDVSYDIILRTERSWHSTFQSKTINNSRVSMKY